ncbi:MAG: MmgE/PrpD family protein [Clostridia bacterium]|nr:MmgE/PrpD family protein [Clostridia bacterium]MDH7572745.1 MmgE/PrpD family protein [Clostridia bacterium]
MEEATHLIAEHFLRVTYEDLPVPVVENTKKQVLDFFGVALGGSNEAGVRELRGLLEEWGGAEQATVIGAGRRLPLPHAAQMNATMAHALDYDDVHEAAVIHPGVVTLPAALAAAEYVGGIDGKELITAVALGTDFICRLGLATRPGQNVHQFGWHLTSIYGYMTAAAVAGRILGLDREALLNAMGIAYHQSAGNGQCVKDGALTKRMGPGFAVRGGVAAALMARGGITGAKNSLEGELGMYRVYHQGSYSRDRLVGELGTRFEGLNVSIKPYPCCRGVHPFIDAALGLVREGGPEPAAVERILIACGEGTRLLLASPLEAKVRPRTPVDSQFSVPWGVAVAVARKRATIKDFSAEAIRSPDILEVAAKIEVEVDPALNRGDEIEPARVTITDRDGRTYSREVQFPTGSPQQPMTFAECERKLRDCLAHAGNPLPEDRVARLVELVSSLENVADVRELIGLTVPAKEVF